MRQETRHEIETTLILYVRDDPTTNLTSNTGRGGREEGRDQVSGEVGAHEGGVVTQHVVVIHSRQHGLLGTQRRVRG